MPVVGFLNGGSPEGYASNVDAFHQGLKEAGYIEGQNVAIENRWANDQYDRLAALADELIRRPVLRFNRRSIRCREWFASKAGIAAGCSRPWPWASSP